MRDHCAACEAGEGHPSYILYTRTGGQRASLYVPDALAAELARAVANGRTLRALLVEAGRRYLHARKARRR